MSSDAKEMIRRVYADVIGGGQFDLLDEFVHDDFVEHETVPGMPTGKEAPRAFMGILRAGFPDIEMSIEGMVEEGDTVMVRARMTGTHNGEFMGIPATGKSVDVPVWDAVRFADGKAIEHWGLMDGMEMMQQLGVVPEGVPG